MTVIGRVTTVNENTLILMFDLSVTLVTSRPESALIRAADLVSAAIRVTGSSIRCVGTFCARRNLPIVGTSTVMTGAAPTTVDVVLIGRTSCFRAREVAAIEDSNC